MDISNPQLNPEWKKIFKNILLKEETLQDNLIYGALKGSANFESEVVKEAPLATQRKNDFSSEFSESKNKLTQFISPVCVSAENLTVNKNNLTFEAELDVNSDMLCRPSFHLKNRKKDKPPEWNKVFKEILGNKPSKDDSSEKNEPLPQIQDMTDPLPQKQNVGSKYGARRKSNCSASGYKRDADEAKVRAQFASWSRVKPLHYEYNLNDFNGAGISIFKDKMQKDVLSFPTRPHSGDFKPSNMPKNSDRPFEKYVPLTGFVAVKRCTKADIRDIRQIEHSEVWDDELLF